MRRFFTLDVFANAALEGNPLAVVLDCEDLSDARMQAIAREFNLSETVFVSPPAEPRHRASVRIFTPAREMAFAGHPIVGAASLLALTENGPAQDWAFGLEAPAGVIPCVVEKEGEGKAIARFRAPVVPSLRQTPATASDLAPALGLETSDLTLGRHAPLRSDAGGPIFQTVPIASVDALARAAPQGEALTRLLGADLCYLYTPAPEADQADWRTRMFGPHYGVPEDPATGSAAVAFAAVLMGYEALGDGKHDVVITQGVEMGRPSRIALQLSVDDGRLDHVEIGGRAVIVSEGTLRL